jgi:hypothetical protein
VHCADYKNRHKNAMQLIFLQKKYEISTVEVQKNIGNIKDQFQRQHKKVIASKKTGSSPRKPSWLNKSRIQKYFAYFGHFFLLIKNIYPPHIPAATSLHNMA